MATTLTLSQAGGERVTLPGITLLAPVKVTVAGLPAASGVAGRPGQGILTGTTLSFTAPWVPIGTTSANTVLTGSDGTLQSIATTFVPSFQGSMTFALRSLFDATLTLGPRSMSQVPMIAAVDPAAQVVPGAPGVGEWMTGAIGAALTRFGGLRLTRLYLAALPGDTTLTLERAAGLAGAGKVRLDGIVYSYTGISGSQLTGVYATSGGKKVAGVQAVHLVGAQVADASGTTSWLDQVGNSYFVATAVGDDLVQLGRDAGVPQSPAVGTDDQLRAIIEALAYSPRGTIYGLTTALNALLGAGTYTLTEDPFGAPCRVSVNVPYNQTSAMTAPGHAYMTTMTALAPTAGSFVLPAFATGVGRIRLRDENSAFSCRSGILTSQLDADGVALWQYSYGNVVSQSVGADNSQATAFVGCNGQIQNLRTPRILPTTSGTFSAFIQIINGAALNATNGMGCGLRIIQSQSYIAGLTGSAAGAVLALRNANNGTALGATVTLTDGVWYQVTLSFTPAGVTLLLNNASISYVAAPTVSTNLYAGALYIGQVGPVVTHQSSAPVLRVRQVELFCRTGTDYGCGFASVTQTDGQRLTSPSYVMGAESIGRQVWVQNSAALNPQGGTNNGAYTVTAAATGNVITLTGPTVAGCSLLVLPSLAKLALPAGTTLWWPQDLGKQIVIASSSQGNAGTYVISDMYDDQTGSALSSMLTKLPQRSRTVRLSQVPTASETGLTVRLQPAFVADSAMTMQTDSGTLVTSDSTQVRVTPRKLPASDVTYDITYGGCSSASLMGSPANRVTVQAGPPVTASQYALYLSSPFSILDGYAQDLTAAGVDLVLNTS